MHRARRRGCTRLFDAVLAVEARIDPPRRDRCCTRVLAGTALVGVALVVNDHLDTASLVTLFLVTTMFVGQVDQLARHLPDLQEGFGAVIRLRGAARRRARADRRRAGLPDGPLDVRFADLHFAYARARFALQHVDLHVPAGTTCALVGRTGSGKSTLASLLSRAVEPERGSVLLGGVDVLDLELQSLRSAVGVVTQRTEILAGTLAENIALFERRPARRGRGRGRRARPRRLGRRAVRTASTPCSVPAAPRLSAGEEQLVAFARLLVRDVSVVVLDEATARMDPVTEANVVRAADRLLSGRTGLLVAHRLSTTERAEQVAVLDAGRVVQRGPRARAGRGAPGRSATLLEASRRATTAAPSRTTARRPGRHRPADRRATRRARALEPVPGLARATTLGPAGRAAVGRAQRGALPGLGARRGAFGAVTGWLWGHVVVDAPAGRAARPLLTAARRGLADRLAAAARRGDPALPALVDRGDAAGPHRACSPARPSSTGCERTPPGEVVARTMDADRLARYADRWVDFVQRAGDRRAHGGRRAEPAGRRRAAGRDGGVRRSPRSLGRRVAGRSAAASAAARARFGRSLVSALDSIRTVKLAAVDPERARATCARSTAAASTPPCASTGCRRCSTAYRS